MCRACQPSAALGFVSYLLARFQSLWKCALSLLLELSSVFDPLRFYLESDG